MHVQEQRIVDGRDLTIVNPVKLDPWLREDVCNQCHLSSPGRATQAGKSPFDFRPGMPLDAVVDFVSYQSDPVRTLLLSLLVADCVLAPGRLPVGVRTMPCVAGGLPRRLPTTGSLLASAICSPPPRSAYFRWRPVRRRGLPGTRLERPRHVPRLVLPAPAGVPLLYPTRMEKRRVEINSCPSPFPREPRR